MKEDLYIEEARFNERTYRLISALLVSLMMASAGLTIAQVGAQIVPEWNGGYLTVIGFFMALECFYLSRTAKRLSVLGRESIVFLSTQWVINLVFIKLIVGLSGGLSAFLAEIPLWQRAFIETFFSPQYLVAVGFAILVWIFAGTMTELLDEMGLDTALIARDAMAFDRDNVPPRQRLMATVFSIGGFLMFLTALSRVDLRAFFSNELNMVRVSLPLLAGGGAGTLLYFLLALILLSQGQYIALNTRWFLQRVPVSRAIASRWAIYTIGFLTLIALIASLLPTSYSLGLLSVLGYLLDILFGILTLIVGFLYLLVGFLISLPFLLLSREAPVDLPPVQLPQILATPPPELAEPGAPIPWLDLLKSVVFWTIFLGVIAYSISQYVRQHEDMLAALRKFPGWRLFAGFWNWITRVFVGINQGVSNIIQAGRERLQPQRKATRLGVLSRFMRLRRLSPRQRVYFYYHAMLRRGNETGLPRKDAQTPDEYATTLERSLPIIETEIDSLTEAFSEARYSQHPVESEDVSIVKAYWERIRQVFRGRRG